MRFSFLAAVIVFSYVLTSECVAQQADLLPGSDYKSAVHFGENDATVRSRFGTHILISVNINGSPMELALDTGANYSLITSPTADALKLKRVKGNYVGCPIQEYRRVKIQIGKVIIENQRLCPNLLYDLNSEVAGKKVRTPGILGYDFLRNFVVDVDYVQRTVVLHNPQTFKYHAGQDHVGEVPFRLVTGMPHIDLAIIFGNESKRKIEALVDTGSLHSLMVTGPVFDELIRIRPFRWEFGNEWVLDIRGFQKYEPSNLAGPINFDAVIGNPALAQYRVIFDYAHNRLILRDPR